jgi:hypothetical protein
LGGYDPPPASLYGQILTAVPASVIAQLANPNGRASIHSEFQAGNTPAWFEAMPTGVRSYILSLQENTPTGCTATPTGTGAGAGQSGGAGAFNEDGQAGKTSSALAPKATQIAAAGLGGVMGFVGLMAML